MTDIKLCPLRYDKDKKEFKACVKENCAWWHYYAKCCAVPTIGGSND